MLNRFQQGTKIQFKGFKGIIIAVQRKDYLIRFDQGKHFTENPCRIGKHHPELKWRY